MSDQDGLGWVNDLRRELAEANARAIQNAASFERALAALTAANARAEAAEQEVIDIGEDVARHMRTIHSRDRAVEIAESEAAALRAEVETERQARGQDIRTLNAEVEKWKGLAHEECQRRSMVEGARNDLRAQVDRLRGTKTRVREAHLMHSLAEARALLVHAQGQPTAPDSWEDSRDAWLAANPESPNPKADVRATTADSAPSTPSTSSGTFDHEYPEVTGYERESPRAATTAQEHARLMQHKVGVISDIVEEARQRGGDMFQYLNRISDAIVDAAPEPRAGAERAVYADFDPSKHLVTREDMTVIGLDKLAQSLCDQALAHGYVLEYKLTRGAVQTSGESPHTAQPFPEWLERAEAEATRKAKP